MYTLFHMKSTRELKVTPARKIFLSLNYSDEIGYYNDCYYICSKQAPLVEKAKEIQREWIEEIVADLAKVTEIKL